LVALQGLPDFHGKAASVCSQDTAILAHNPHGNYV
jgi:hypothetical protein